MLTYPAGFICNNSESGGGENATSFPSKNSYGVFDGTSDYVAFYLDPNDFTDEATLSVWIKLVNNTPTVQGQTGFMGPGSSNNHYPWIDGNFI